MADVIDLAHTAGQNSLMVIIEKKSSTPDLRVLFNVPSRKTRSTRKTTGDLVQSSRAARKRNEALIAERRRTARPFAAPCFEMQRNSKRKADRHGKSIPFPACNVKAIAHQFRVIRVSSDLPQVQNPVAGIIETQQGNFPSLLATIL
jgi:hypothetical protein